MRPNPIHSSNISPIRSSARRARHSPRGSGHELHITTLSDHGDLPVRASIMRSLDTLRTAKGVDTVVVFLASHGISDKQGNYYFVPRDARRNDIDTLLDGGTLPPVCAHRGPIARPAHRPADPAAHRTGTPGDVQAVLIEWENIMEFGSELRKRASPELAAKMRRDEQRSCIVAILIGLFITGDGLYASAHGGWMWIGRAIRVEIPWWLATVVGLMMVGFSVYLLVQASRPTRKAE